MVRILCMFWLASFVCLSCGDSTSADGNGNDAGSGVYCGNGILEPGEECDEGEYNSDTEPDGCRTNCRAALCGDGVGDSNEDCDEE